MPATERRRPPAGLPAVALALASLAGPAPLHAQFAAIEPGRTVEGSLGPQDPVASQRGPFRVFSFAGRAGQRLTATLTSAEFDAYLRLAREVGGITDELESDDDSGGETQARLRFTLPADGTYLLIAQALEPEGSGAFTLWLDPTEAPTTAAARAIRIGASEAGELAETDAIQDDDDTFYDTWTVDATAGQRLVVSMEAEAFDAFLSVGRTESGGEFSSIASNDDGTLDGDGTNARMRVRIPDTGSWEIRANSVGVATGPYRLSVIEGPQPPTAAQEHAAGPGEDNRGELDGMDAVLDDDTYYEYWLYEGRAGERLTVRMSSTEFDTFLAFGRLAGRTFDEISSNDDGPDGTDSEIEVTLPRDGRYAIRAGALSAGETGAFTLVVTRSR